MHVFKFGHAEFKMLLRYSHGNAKEVIRCMNLEVRRKAYSREINLGVMSIVLVIKTIKIGETPKWRVKYEKMRV